MAEDTDQSQKTEEPTPKKLADARKKGDLPKSQDIPIWFVMLGGATLILLSGYITSSLGETLHRLLDHPHAFAMTSEGLMDLTRGILWRMMPFASVVFGILMVFAMAGHLSQHLPLWTAEKMKPKLNKISPISGLKRMFGPQGWMNLLKGVLKLIAIAAATTAAVWPDIHLLEKVGAMDLSAVVAMLLDIATRLFLVALIVVGLIAAMDFAFQKHSFMQKMKMTRQEVRDEMKQSDGDPQVKAKIRQLRQERSRRRMLADVPNATVIVTNPTHYSIALKYDDETPAPVCVAKGVDELALRIREAGIAADVPLVENPPLARALYATVELDEPIPREHFEAVAKIIGFVMKTKRRPGAKPAG